MNLRELEVFRAIMLSGTVTEAARQLRVSQPAVSMALANAEHRLGMKLFERRNRRLVATPEAEVLYAEIEPIFGRLSALRSLASSLKDIESGVITIAGTATLSYTFIVDAVERFKRRWPGVRVVIEVGQTPQITEMVETRQADLGLVYTAWPTEAVEVVPLPTYHLTCAVRRDSPLADAPYIQPQMLADTPLIVNAHNPNFVKIQEAFRRVGVTLNYSLGSNQSTLIGLLVQLGQGVGIVDPWLRTDMLPGIVLRPFRPQIRLQPRIIHARTRPLSRAAERLLEILTEVASAGPFAAPQPLEVAAERPQRHKAAL